MQRIWQAHSLCIIWIVLHIRHNPVAHVVYEIVFPSVLYMTTWHTRLGHRDIGLKPKLSAIPIVYDYYDAKF